MAITGIFSYLPTTQEFANHWQTVNMARPNAPIVLPMGITLADFNAMVGVMNAAFNAVVPAATLERTASAQVNLARASLQPRFVQFNQTVRLYLSHGRFADATVEVPGIGAGEAIYRDAGLIMSSSWDDINSATDLAPFVVPLTLPNFDPDNGATYTLDDFEPELAALLTAFDADLRATAGATQKRANRNALLPAIKQAMKDYRGTCQLELPKGSALLKTLPRLTPKPGTTPPALVVSGGWDAALLKAVLQWEQSKAPDLLKLQVRGCLGGTYKNDEEEIVADLPSDATSWRGDWGLTAPGSIASFKIYVMNTHSNENGGKAIKIVRPVT